MSHRENFVKVPHYYKILPGYELASNVKQTYLKCEKQCQQIILKQFCSRQLLEFWRINSKQGIITMNQVSDPCMCRRGLGGVAVVRAFTFKL